MSYELRVIDGLLLVAVEFISTLDPGGDKLCHYNVITGCTRSPYHACSRSS